MQSSDLKGVLSNDALMRCQLTCSDLVNISLLQCTKHCCAMPDTAQQTLIGVRVQGWSGTSLAKNDLEGNNPFTQVNVPVKQSEGGIAWLVGVQHALPTASTQMICIVI